MKINIKSTNVELNEALRVHIEEKLGELEKFLGAFGPENLVSGEKEKIELWVEIGKTTKHHLKGDVFRAEVQFHLPKKSIRAEAINTDLRTAINEAKDELQREIKQYKEKRLGKDRRWARTIKEKFRTSSLLRRNK